MDEANKIPLLAVVGPTASGKTRLAVELALQTHGEVVSADSMQISRGMDIGTAKPTPEEQRGVPHHLIDFADPAELFSVARYVELARACIQEIHGRGKLPVLAGGTGLYVNAVLDHLQFAGEERDPTLREALKARAEREGGAVLLEELRSFDPETAARLHPADLGRIIRAIELYRATGVTMTEQIARSRREEPPYRVCMLGLTYRDRDLLYRKINARVDDMLRRGLLAEAEAVFRSPGGKTAVQAIGYKELFSCFRGEQPLEAAVEDLKQSTRRYAKRQLSWFRRDSRIHWIYVDECGDFSEIVKNSFQYMELDGIL